MRRLVFSVVSGHARCPNTVATIPRKHANALWPERVIERSIGRVKFTVRFEWRSSRWPVKRYAFARTPVIVYKETNVSTFRVEPLAGGGGETDLHRTCNRIDAPRGYREYRERGSHARAHITGTCCLEMVVTNVPTARSVELVTTITDRAALVYVVAVAPFRRVVDDAQSARVDPDVEYVARTRTRDASSRVADDRAAQVVSSECAARIYFVRPVVFQTLSRRYHGRIFSRATLKRNGLQADKCPSSPLFRGFESCARTCGHAAYWTIFVRA